MLRKKNSEPAQLPEARQELLEFESPAAQPGKKDPKQFLKHNWKKITAVVCVTAVAAAVLLPKTSKKDVQASTQYVEAALERRDITNTFSGSGTISAANTYTVKSLVKGTVLTADFEVGDTIEKGTVTAQTLPPAWKRPSSLWSRRSAATTMPPMPSTSAVSLAARWLPSRSRPVTT